ncbi:MAG: HEAT repeat domain-containing protein, partial [Myxococcales bacterium]|nr:HEAT repeat domain-containing protein [Polyangiaceae bacterium]MDW8251133.1 HEAT repeat domain-containing protein [Myxococcales bacterium]
PSRWRERASHEAPHWRAVGARSLTEPEQGELRRALFADLFSSVRHAAFRAALDALDPRDQPMLLEAVRLDPEEEIRITAAQGVGALGGEQAVLALKDRWVSGSEPVRLAILRAWGTRASYNVGGRDQLFWAAEHEQGTPSLVASLILLRGPSSDADVGRGGFLRAMAEGGATTRVMAISLANLEDDVQLKLVEKAAEDGEGPVRVAALGRLTERKDRREQALLALGEIAVGSSHERNAARSALARARDRRVVQLLAEDTRAQEPGVRAWAAGELAAMKEFPYAAQCLADAEPSVRNRVACAILAVPR